MEQHPVPRQITSFEFKLIGFLTLRQFIYITLFSAIGVIFFYGIPIPIINIIATIISVLIGVAFAFITFNERPLDVFVKNFIIKLTSPTQYYYQKKNEPPPFLANTHLSDSKEVIHSHIVARQKLTHYLNTKNNHVDAHHKEDKNKKIEKKIFDLPKIFPKKPRSEQVSSQPTNTPFLSGIIKNNKEIPIPEILMYIKNKEEKLLRILKTNAHGHFATFHPLDQGEYTVYIKDPKKIYFFDDLPLVITDKPQNSLTILSKELL